MGHDRHEDADAADGDHDEGHQHRAIFQIVLIALAAGLDRALGCGGRWAASGIGSIGPDKDSAIPFVFQ
jgi:hypothetical protein